MHHTVIDGVRKDFLAFSALALRELDGTKMSEDRYLDVLANAAHGAA